MVYLCPRNPNGPCCTPLAARVNNETVVRNGVGSFRLTGRAQTHGAGAEITATTATLSQKLCLRGDKGRFSCGSRTKRLPHSCHTATNVSHERLFRLWDEMCV